MLSCCPENCDVDSPPLFQVMGVTFLLGLCWLAVCSPESHVNHKWAKPGERRPLILVLLEMEPTPDLGCALPQACPETFCQSSCRVAMMRWLPVCPGCRLPSKHKTGVTAAVLDFFALLRQGHMV